MTIGNSGGHFLFYILPFLISLLSSLISVLFRHSFYLPSFSLPSVILFTFCHSLTVPSFSNVPSFPTRSGIPPVILSERSESKDLLKTTPPRHQALLLDRRSLSPSR